MAQRPVKSLRQICLSLLTLSASIVVSATSRSHLLSASALSSPGPFLTDDLTTTRTMQTTLVPSTVEMSTDRSITINYETRQLGREGEELLRKVESDHGLQNAISSLKVHGYGSIANWTLLSSALSHIRRLNELHWFNMDPIPASVLSVLEERHPECKLYYEMQFSNWDCYDRTVPPIQFPGQEIHHSRRAAERALILNSNNLYSLKTVITYGRDSNTEDLMLVHRILITCLNLRELNLSIKHDGCVMGGGQPYHLDFSEGNPLSNETFPPLEMLKIRGYRLENSERHDHDWFIRPAAVESADLRWPLSRLPGVLLDFLGDIGRSSIDLIGGFNPASRAKYFGYEHIDNLDAWLERMDWSKLRSLNLGHASTSTLQKLRPALTNLENLTLNGGDCCNAASVVEFLRNATNSQTSLSLWNFDFNSFDPLINALTLKHHDLQSLLLAEPEDMRSHWCLREENRNHPICVAQEGRGYWYDAHLYLNASQLGQLSTGCSTITDLDIDVDRTLPLSEFKHVFATLATFPHLKSLTTRLESPSFLIMRNGSTADPAHGRQAKTDPLLNQSFVQQLFHDLRAQQQQNFLVSQHDTHGHNPQIQSPQQQPAALKRFQVIVGDWSKASSRREYYPAHGPSRYLLGSWTCSIIVGNDQTGTETEDCKGEVRWARSWEEFPDMSLNDGYDDGHRDDDDEDDDDHNDSEGYENEEERELEKLRREMMG